MNEIGIGIGVGIDSVSWASKPNGNPSALTLTVLSDTSIKCDWTNGATNQNGTYVYTSLDGVTNWTLSGTAIGALTTKTLTGLTENTTYYIKVVHYKGAKLSEYSNIVSATTYAHETMVYKSYVEADGGTIIDINYVDSTYKLILTNSIYSKLKVWLSPNAGVKINTGKIEKLYNLTADSLADQSDVNKRAAMGVNTIFSDKQSIITTGSESYYISNINLPLYLDGWHVGYSPLTGSMAIMEHGNSTVSNDGFGWFSSGGRLILRRTTSHYINKTDKWSGTTRYIGGFNYSNSEIVTKRDNEDLVNTPVVGTQLANTSVTANLNIFSRNQSSIFYKGNSACIVLFETLTPTQRDIIYNHLNSYYFNNSLTLNLNHSSSFYDSQRFPFSTLDFQYDGTELAVSCNTNIYANYPQYSNIAVFVNGVYNQKIDVANTDFNRITLPSGNKTISLVEGLVSKPTSLYLGTRLSEVRKAGNASYLYPITNAEKIVFLTDSIGVGGNSTIAQKDAFTRLLNINDNKYVTVFGFGYGRLKDFAENQSVLNVVIPKIISLFDGATDKKLIITLGTNDFGLDSTSAAVFIGWYNNLIDQLHTADSGIKVYCISPLRRGSDNPLLASYRTNIEQSCINRPLFTEYLNGYDAVLYPDNFDADTIHLNDNGHTEFYNKVKLLIS